MGMQIHPACSADDAVIWRMLEPVIRAGETYALERDLTQADALRYWHAPGHEVFVAEEGDELVGTYFLQANQRGGGAHVSNCGYITAMGHTGKGVARAMCTHSLAHAKSRGFTAMQFNLVVSTNERAVKLWQQLGFQIVGTIPGAFHHPAAGFVEAYVMFQTLR